MKKHSLSILLSVMMSSVFLDAVYTFNNKGIRFKLLEHNRQPMTTTPGRRPVVVEDQDARTFYIVGADVHRYNIPEWKITQKPTSPEQKRKNLILRRKATFEAETERLRFLTQVYLNNIQKSNPDIDKDIAFTQARQQAAMVIKSNRVSNNRLAVVRRLNRLHEQLNSLSK